MNRAPTAVRIVGASPITVKLEKARPPAPHRRAPLKTLMFIFVILILAASWILWVVLPSVTFKYVRGSIGSIEVFLVVPSLTFVGDDTDLVITIVNRGMEPFSGTASIELSSEPMTHLKEDGDTVITIEKLAHGARVSKPIRIVALAGGKLRIELWITEPAALCAQARAAPGAPSPAAAPEVVGCPQSLLSQTVLVCPFPWLNQLRSWIFGVLLSALGYLTLPWLKIWLKGLLPAE